MMKDVRISDKTIKKEFRTNKSIVITICFLVSFLMLIQISEITYAEGWGTRFDSNNNLVPSDNFYASEDFDASDNFYASDKFDGYPGYQGFHPTFPPTITPTQAPNYHISRLPVQSSQRQAPQGSQEQGNQGDNPQTTGNTPTGNNLDGSQFSERPTDTTNSVLQIGEFSKQNGKFKNAQNYISVDSSKDKNHNTNPNPNPNPNPVQLDTQTSVGNYNSQEEESQSEPLPEPFAKRPWWSDFCYF